MTFPNRKDLIPLRALPLPSTALPPCPGLYQEAGTFDRRDYLLDPDLVAPLLIHLAMHYVPGLKIENQRGLLIAGHPGDTKSTTIKVIASRHRIDVLQMPAADLCGATEGLAAHRLNEAYAYMRAKSAETGRHFLFQLDDLDASIIEERQNQERTVNTNILIGKLQSILESPDGFRDAMGIANLLERDKLVLGNGYLPASLTTDLESALPQLTQPAPAALSPPTIELKAIEVRPATDGTRAATVNGRRPRYLAV